jgi:hypothetical protein
MPNQMRIFGRLTHTGGVGPVANAEILLARRADPSEVELCRYRTSPAGLFDFEVDCVEGTHSLRCGAFGKSCEHNFEVAADCAVDEIRLDLPLGFRLSIHNHADHDERLVPAGYAIVGRRVLVRAETAVDSQIESYAWTEHRDAQMTELGREAELVFARPGHPVVEAMIVERDPQKAEKASAKTSIGFAVSESDIQRIGGHISVSLDRPGPDNETADQALWVAIRERTNAISFDRYQHFIRRVLLLEEETELTDAIARRASGLGSGLHGVGAYQLMKFITEAFLLRECGVRIDPHRRRHHAFDPGEESWRLGRRYSREDLEYKLREYLGSPPQLPYIKRVVDAAFPDTPDELFGPDRLLSSQLGEPLLIELIHTYFLEEGMLMQSINAVTQRFQNVRSERATDPLANFEYSPLRHLSSLIWGYIQDEPNRLSVRRRAAEYVHEYGLTLFGRATVGLQPADTRSTFLEALHNLLHQCSIFFKEDYQTTVIADGFRLLNALKDVHLILAQGAQNQFRDLPWTARVETLLEQFMLAQPEMQRFLQSRVMVPYKEPWMAQVDAMKSLQGWTDVTVTHFRDLATYGEQILLSVRYGDWINVNDDMSARNWARYWRPELQAYMHAYRAATGVDLTNPDTAIDATIPAVHLQRRLLAQRARSEAPGVLALPPNGGGRAMPPNGGRAMPRLASRIQRSK